MSEFIPADNEENAASPHEQEIIRRLAEKVTQSIELTLAGNHPSADYTKSGQGHLFRDEYGEPIGIARNDLHPFDDRP